MALNRRLAAAAFGVLAMGGIGAGVANAATTNTAPPPNSSTVDTLTPGDTADAPGAVDTPTPGDTPDAPAAAGADSAQQGAQSGDQGGAEVEDGPAGAPEAGN